MKINYGIGELKRLHEQLTEYYSEKVDSTIIEEMACNAFLAEAYELEVTKHGGLSVEKIEEYKALCGQYLGCEKEFV